jgi:hypothetical protein
VTHTTSLVYTVTVPLPVGAEYDTGALNAALDAAQLEADTEPSVIVPGTPPSGTATMYEPGSAPSLRVWWNL